MPDHECFATVDLYEEQNMNQVVICIAALMRKVRLFYQTITRPHCRRYRNFEWGFYLFIILFISFLISFIIFTYPYLLHGTEFCLAESGFGHIAGSQGLRVANSHIYYFHLFIDITVLISLTKYSQVY